MPKVPFVKPFALRKLVLSSDERLNSMKAKSVLSAVVAVAAGLLAGCETVPPGTDRGPHGTIPHNVAIEASEPGVKIRATGEDVGTAPMTLKIYGDKDGTFHDFGSYEYIIQAFPTKTNQYVQTRVFQTGRMFTPEDKIPPQIYFDMNQPPPAYPPPTYYYYPPPAYPYPYFYYHGYFGAPYHYGPHYYGRPPLHLHQENRRR